jgi:hypothetical protein
VLVLISGGLYKYSAESLSQGKFREIFLKKKIPRNFPQASWRVPAPSRPCAGRMRMPALRTSRYEAGLHLCVKLDQFSLGSKRVLMGTSIPCSVD